VFCCVSSGFFAVAAWNRRRRVVARPPIEAEEL